MANPEHLKELKKGVKSWNKWRKDNPNIKPDLSGSNLTKKIFYDSSLKFKEIKKNSKEVRRGKLIPINFANMIFKEVDFTESILIGANFYNSIFKDVKFIKAHITGAIFERVELYNVKFDYLKNAKDARFHNIRKTNNLSFIWANLNHVSILNANFNNSNLSQAKINDSDIALCNLQDCNLSGASLIKTYLVGSKIEKANLSGVNLLNANVSNTTFDKLKNIKKRQYKKKTANYKEVIIRNSLRYKGITVNGCRGSEMFVRFAKDQAFLDEFFLRHPILYRIWSLSCNCGQGFRGIIQWFCWSVFFIFIFAGIFTCLGEKNLFLRRVEQKFQTIEVNKNSTVSLNDTNPLFIEKEKTIYYGLKNNFPTMLYYSVATFTTLGFGDVTPLSYWGTFWISLEVIIGYIMLGGLISIFATMIARRS